MNPEVWYPHTQNNSSQFSSLKINMASVFMQELFYKISEIF